MSLSQDRNTQLIRSMRELLARADQLSRPFRAHYEITYRCNLDCRHCYVEQGSCPEEAPCEEVVEALRRAGVLFVVISGGEPLARNDWQKLIEAVRRNRMAYRIMSNGTLLSREDALFLRSTGATAVDISIYAPQDAHAPGGGRVALHDYITGMEGSLDTALAAVDTLRSIGVKVIIKSPIFALNYRYAAELRRLAERLGCGFVGDTTFVRPAVNGCDGCRKLSEDEMRELFTHILPLDKEGLLASPRGNLCGDITCAAGRSTLRVRPDGSVTPCVALPVTVARARGNEITEAWRSHPELARLRALSVEDLPECRECPEKESCVRCPGMAVEEGGSIYGATPSTCLRTRMLAGLRSAPEATA